MLKSIFHNFVYNFFQIEAASKYSTVDTLKQQYRFLPAKYKVNFSVTRFYFSFVGKKQHKWQLA